MIHVSRRASAVFLAMFTAVIASGPSSAQTSDPVVEVVVNGLEVPWSIAFAPDGRLFIAERPGRIRVVEEGVLRPQPWITLQVTSPEGSEAGLMGLAVDPAFESNGYLYACHSYASREGGILNRIVRLRESSGAGTEPTTLVDALPGERFHNGCRLGFGPDGMLYATTGDGIDETRPQDLESMGGKVLRMQPDGGVPPDNPFPGSLVWSLGHRNAQGIAWQPGTGQLWSPEHGSSDYNELNRIIGGGNYGWPIVRAEAQRDEFERPVFHLRDIPPAGAAFITGERYPGFEGDLAFAMLGAGSLMVARIGEDNEVTGLEWVIDDRFGRLRDVVMGPDGYLYVTTSNRDQLGDPREGDDTVFRIVRF